MSASYKFLPWVRQGAATAIRKLDTLGAGLPGRVTMPVSLQINKRTDADVRVTVRLHGPGDITGIDQRQVVRTDPPHLTTDFEPNYFPAIEFDLPDFPWMFTPAAGDGQGRLRPWICLVVVRKQSGVSLKVEARQPLPVLRIAPPAVPRLELPDLADSWAWAHTQVATGATAGSLSDLLASESPLNASRLICPRKLVAQEQYLACVVPAFESGRKAGLGLTLGADDEQKLTPAWNIGADAPAELELPVYYHWEFGTGLSGDFESLVRLLEARPLPDGVGVRPMDVSSLPFQLPDLGTLALEGALRPTDFEPVDPEKFSGFQDKLRELSNLSDTLSAGNGKGPVVGPPVYGRWQSSRTSIPGDDETPHWLRELNLDPRSRVIAGFGTLVVQDQQEQLMASAWEQLGERRANQLLRHAQLAREVSGLIFAKRFKPLGAVNPDRLFQITAPVHARVRMSPETFFHQVRQSALPHRALSASFRRIVRPGGPVVRQVAPELRRQTAPFVRKLAAGQLRARIVAKPPGSIVTADLLEAQSKRFMIAHPVLMRMRQAERAYTGYFKETQTLGGASTRMRIAASALPALQAKLLQGLDPAVTTARRVEEQIVRPDGSPEKPGDPLAPVTTAPQFPQPMYETLRDLSQDLLLPGLEHIPPNTVVLLETNTRFVEAFMVGLNHEMSRELLWREFPTDQRESYFRRFWDDSGALQNRPSDQLDPIHLWPPERHLGENFKTGGSDEHLVLLIKGELLQRYPTATIYAVRAARAEGATRRSLGTEELYPLFQGRLKPDITFFGFPLTAEQALGAVDESGKPASSGDPGWYFVIQQQPTEPRFGLDVPTPENFGAKPAAWRDASWAHLVENEQELAALTHVGLSGRLRDHKIGNVAWGQNAAHMASITLQRPVRIAIHASALLPG